MRPRHRNGALLGGLVLAGAALIVAPAGPASAAECPGTSGVTVIVDTGSSITTRCASGDPKSGLAALSAAGFSVTQVQTQPGFTCRIDGFPSKDKDPCRVAPPTSAYWSYWYAPKGGSWSYSSRGAGSHDPAPGSVEGWRFGSGQQPRVSPPAEPKPPAPEPTPTKKTTPTAKATATAKPKAAAEPKATTTPKSSATRSSTPSTGSTTKPKATSASTGTPAAKAAAPKPTQSTPGTKSPAADPSAAAAEDNSASPAPPEASGPSAAELALVAQAAGANSNGGGPTTLIAGGVLVALVAAGAGLVARKRRA